MGLRATERSSGLCHLMTINFTCPLDQWLLNSEQKIEILSTTKCVYGKREGDFFSHTQSNHHNSRERGAKLNQDRDTFEVEVRAGEMIEEMRLASTLAGPSVTAQNNTTITHNMKFEENCIMAAARKTEEVNKNFTIGRARELMGEIENISRFSIQKSLSSELIRVQCNSYIRKLLLRVIALVCAHKSSRVFFSGRWKLWTMKKIIKKNA